MDKRQGAIMRTMDSQMKGAFARFLSEIVRDVEKEERYKKIRAELERKPYKELEVNRNDDTRKE